MFKATEETYYTGYNPETIQAEDAYDIIRKIEDWISDKIEEEYRDALDEEGTVTVAGYEYYPSRILEEVDPIAYRCGLADYSSYRLDEIRQEIESLDEGDEEEYYGVTVTKEA